MLELIQSSQRQTNTADQEARGISQPSIPTQPIRMHMDTMGSSEEATFILVPDRSESTAPENGQALGCCSRILDFIIHLPAAIVAWIASFFCNSSDSLTGHSQAVIDQINSFCREEFYLNVPDNQRGEALLQAFRLLPPQAQRAARQELYNALESRVIRRRVGFDQISPHSNEGKARIEQNIKHYPAQRLPIIISALTEWLTCPLTPQPIPQQENEELLPTVFEPTLTPVAELSEEHKETIRAFCRKDFSAPNRSRDTISLEAESELVTEFKKLPLQAQQIGKDQIRASGNGWNRESSFYTDLPPVCPDEKIYQTMEKYPAGTSQQIKMAFSNWLGENLVFFS